MGDPSYFIVVAKNLVLNWGALSRSAQHRILQELRQYCPATPRENLPPTFEDLMKVFDHRKFYGYLVPPILDILSECLPAFPETGVALFIHCSGPVVFVFDPSADRFKTMIKEGHPTGEPLDFELCQQLVSAAARDAAAATVTTESKSEECRLRLRASTRATRGHGAHVEHKIEEQETPESEFYEDVVVPLQALESAKAQIRFLQTKGLRIEPPLSRETLRAIQAATQLQEMLFQRYG